MSKAFSWLLAIALVVPSAGWAAGTLDSTFGVDGVVTPPPEGSFFAAANLPGNRLVAVGRLNTATPLIMRLLDDGTPDVTFGVAGMVTTPPGSATSWAFGGVVVQPDGKLVITGVRTTIIPPHYPAEVGMMTRYDANGAPDPSFGIGGLVLLQNYFAYLNGHPRLQPDGKIVVSGTELGTARVWRFNADGSLDPSFGTGGIAVLGEGLVNHLVLLPDGRILVVINRSEGPVALARLDANGQLDPSFGTGGVAEPPLPLPENVPVSLARLSDGKLLVVGFTPSFGSEKQAFLLRFDQDGALDPTFGNAGLIISPETLGDTFVLSVVVTDDGRMVLGGQVGYYALLVAYDSAGAIDASFGTGGIAKHPAVWGGAGNLTLQPNDRLLSAGGVLARWRLDDDALCTAAPRALCKAATAAGKSKLIIKAGSSDTKDRILWTWTKGSATSLAELGVPQTSTGYAFCVYDGAPALVATLRAPGGGSCAGSPCWETAGALGFTRTDTAGASDGLTALRVQSGVDGKAKARLKAKGEDIPTPILPLSLPVRVQLQASNGSCWEATYTTAKTNDTGRFQAKSD